MNLIFEANIINACGVVVCLFAHYLLSCTDKQKAAFLITSLGCVFITVGSSILGSWPVVALNVLWIAISMSGYYDYEPKIKGFGYFVKTLYVAFALGVLFIATGEFTKAAWCTTYIYVAAYAGYATKATSRTEYLVWCQVGFFVVLAHLFDVFQYSVLVGEFVGAAIGAWGLINIFKAHRMREQVSN